MTRNQPEWRRRVLALARSRSDKAAVAIIEGGRRYSPEPPAVIFTARLGERRAA